jgi:basic membrane protein A
MQKRRRMILGLLLLLLPLILVACGGGGSTGSAASPAAGTSAAGSAASSARGSGATGKKVGLVLSGPVGVNPFLKAIKDGIEKAGQELGLQTTVIESRDIPAIEGNLKRLVQERYDLIVCNSFECVDALQKVAPQNPNQRFLIVDATVDAPNVSSAVFREHESAFLAGAEAAMVTKAKKVGFVGAMDIPLLHRWSEGYQQGVNQIDPSIPVQIAWMGSFEDVAKAKELATIQANQGADIIFPAAAAGIFGAFEAAKSKGFKTIAVDVDYREQYPDVVIDSQLKNTDVVTYESVKAFANGALEPGTKSYGLKENGVALASLSKPNAISDQALGPDVIKRLKELQDKIISGEIQVKDPLAQP